MATWHRRRAAAAAAAGGRTKVRRRRGEQLGSYRRLGSERNRPGLSDNRSPCGTRGRACKMSPGLNALVVFCRRVFSRWTSTRGGEGTCAMNNTLRVVRSLGFVFLFLLPTFEPGPRT